MKRLLCILFSVILTVSSLLVFADAKTSYNATWTFKANANGKSYASGSTIAVNPGDKVKVTLHLANNYYTGPTCFQIFYTNTLFERASSGEFNTKGRLYGVSGKTHASFVDWEKISAGNRKLGWPNYSAEKLAEYKKDHQFLRVTLTPNVMITTTAVGNLNEDLITITFDVSKSAKPGAEGEITLPIESRRTKNYKTGYFYSAICTTSDLTGTVLPYSDAQHFTCNTTLKFKVNSSSQKGDVNKDGRINSADALLVLQYSVGNAKLSSEQITLADVNNDKRVNSADALKILQYAVGQINKF